MMMTSVHCLLLPQAVCPSGYACTRLDQWNAQCMPARRVLLSAAPPASPIATPPPLSTSTVSTWSQCGGSSNCGGNTPCSDAAWSTVSSGREATGNCSCKSTAAAVIRVSLVVIVLGHQLPPILAPCVGLSLGRGVGDGGCAMPGDASHRCAIAFAKAEHSSVGW